MRTILRSLNVLLIAAFFIACALLWNDLPARIPTHFTFSGTPDAWSEKSFWTWFGLPTIALVLAVFMYFMGRWIHRSPRLVNLPNKKRFLQLSPEGQRQVLGTVTAFLDGVSVTVTLLMGLIQIDVYRAAQGAQGSIVSAIAVVAMSVALTVGAIVMMVRLQNGVDRLYKEEVGRGTGVAGEG